MEEVFPDHRVLFEVISVPVPFGKFKGTLVCDLPVSYLEWMKNKGFPPGRMGMLLSTAYEMKVNGLGKLLFQIKAAHQERGGLAENH